MHSGYQGSIIYNMNEKKTTQVPIFSKSGSTLKLPETTYRILLSRWTERFSILFLSRFLEGKRTVIHLTTSKRES